MFDPDQTDSEGACYHEAGHALIARLLGGVVVECTIEDDDDGLAGRTTVQWRNAGGPDHARALALTALAGPVAEARFLGDMDLLDSLAAWEHDWRHATAAIAQWAPPTHRATQIRQLVAELAARFADPDVWERLCRIADALSAHGTLDAGLIEEAAE